jgi:hypothetical protein
MENNSRIEIEKFNGQNFELWKLKIGDLLVDHEKLIAMNFDTIPTGMSKEYGRKLRGGKGVRF